MKIIVPKENIKNILIQAERFTGKNINLPILGNILFETRGKKCFIIATNLELALEASFPCKVIKEGKIAVPSRIITTLLQTVPEENITLEEKGNALLIQSENSKISINGTDSRDFPIIPRLKSPHSIVISFYDALEGIQSVMSAVSRSDSKPEISGVLLKIDGKKAKFAATDTYRLSEKTTSLTSGDEEKGSIIVPLKACEEIVRFQNTRNGDDALHVFYSENQAVFEFGDQKMTTRLIDGVFPEYGAIIPKNSESRMIFTRQELMQKIRAASILSSKLNDIILRFGGSELSVESSASELGSVKSKIALKQFEGKEGTLSFNFRYLLDGLDSISDAEVSLGISGDSAASILRSQNDDSFFYVLMPIRNI
ncbi:MAG: DNA polymerase III subunit beta [Candidatus Sungbacteria bacterium RIFCSPLOWO2_01_FULL_47_10]|uniref:Beta sliding clamp n=1 Tax=Candidatus Sungbacteria bacterium RIFCSPLOWO2_01_FULL_47_10 TaxID=1802276 RepID=A0A1G2L7F1_9BACT|nr:MAG: DNA polymerase III subunit beta [Candidatus Sungbacteria bacterium RIFCSPLOWO2_01_FULL_47_10]